MRFQYIDVNISTFDNHNNYSNDEWRTLSLSYDHFPYPWPLLYYSEDFYISITYHVTRNVRIFFLFLLKQNRALSSALIIGSSGGLSNMRGCFREFETSAIGCTWLNFETAASCYRSSLVQFRTRNWNRCYRSDPHEWNSHVLHRFGSMTV